MALAKSATRVPLWRSRCAMGVGLFVLAIGVYLPTLWHDWLNYDDNLYITENVELARGISGSGVAWAFTTFYGANWFPLTWLSWMLDFEIFGLEAAGFHATNALQHAFCTWLLFLALARMTGQLERSAFVAAIFAVHPLHVESVAWAAARKDTLSGCFFMLALYVYARNDWRSARQRFAVWACTLCALMAKPTAVTLPFVLLLLDVWPLRRLHIGARDGVAQVRRSIAEKMELFVTVAVMCGVVLAAQGSGGVVAELDRLGMGARVGNALVSYATYAGKALWPSGLAVLYPHPGSALPFWQPALAAAFLCAVTLGTLALARRDPSRAYAPIGWLWFVGMLVPMIGIVQVGSQAMADRYMYLPLVGLTIAITWGISDLARDRSALLRGCAIAIVSALALVSLFQLRHWRDSEALFRHTLRVTVDNHIAHAHLGAAFLKKGEPAKTIDHYLESIRLRPDSADVANNLAWLLATARDPALRNPYLALRLAERATTLTSRKKSLYLDTLAAAYAANERFDEAIATARESADLSRSLGLEAQARASESRLHFYRAEEPIVQ